MADTKDTTTPLEYLVAGLVVLSFGLLYYLLNHNNGFWSDSDQNAATYSDPTQIPEIAEEKQGLAAWLGTTSAPAPSETNTATATVTTPAEEEQEAAVQETVVPEPDTQLQSGLNEELARLRNEVAQHKAEISQLKQAASGQNQSAEMQEVVRAKPEPQTEEPQMAEGSAEDQLQQLISNPQTNQNQAITLDKIFFDTGSARLKSTSLPQIEAVAKQLMANGKTKILIRGHSDNTGSAQQNSLLSLSRSSSMKEALSQMGVEASRIRIEGVGPLEPIASNDTAEGRKKNRRIELIVIE